MVDSKVRSGKVQNQPETPCARKQRSLQGMLESGPGDWADSVPAEPQGKPKNTGVGRLSFLQWIFLTQDLKRGLLHCQWILYFLVAQTVKASAYNAVDPGSIPGSGGSSGEGNGNPLLYLPWTEEPTVLGIANSRARLSDFTFTSLSLPTEL